MQTAHKLRKYIGGCLLAIRDHRMHRAHGQSVRSKIVLSLAGVLVAFLVLQEISTRCFIQPAFFALERNEGIKDAGRVAVALQHQTDRLADLASNLSVHATHDCVDAAVSAELSSDKVDSVRIVDGLMKIASLQDSGDELTLSPDQLVVYRTLLQDSVTRPTRGIVKEPDGQLVSFAIVNLTEPDNLASNARQRFLLARKRLDDELFDSIRNETRVDFVVRDPVEPNLARESQITREESGRLVVRIPLRDVHRNVVATVVCLIPGNTTEQAVSAVRTARNHFAMGSVAAVLLLMLMLQLIILNPLRTISEHAANVAHNGIDVEPIQIDRDDEIGAVGQSLQHMINRLRQSQMALTESSHAAGMSQVASTVVHNVGNVLTNVNSLIEATQAKVSHLRIEPLQTLATRINDDDMDLELIQAAPNYLAALSASLRRDRDDIHELLGTLESNLVHINGVIREQQRHANRNQLMQRFAIGEVIEESIDCCRARLEADRIRVAVDGDVNVEICSDRSAILQILINLISNARTAFRDVDPAHRRIVVRVRHEDSTIELAITDNACGISKANLKRIFQPSFTTNSFGSGLGLHYCQLAISRLGGSIVVQSDGEGRGATFRICIPADSQSFDSILGTPTVRDKQDETIAAPENSSVNKSKEPVGSHA